METTRISIGAYRASKKRLIDIEKDNCSSIYAIPCSGDKDWYELADNSALIYYYHVCEKLKLKTKFISDEYSFYEIYNIGYMRSKGLDNIRKNLKRVDLYESESTTDLIHIFHLNSKFTQAHLKKLAEQEIKRRNTNLTPEPAYNLDPELHHILVEPSIRLNNLCNNHLNKLSSRTIGTDIIKLTHAILLSYHAITFYKPNERTKIIKRLTTIHRDLRTLLAHIQIASELKLWDVSICAKIAEPLTRAVKITEHHIKNMSKNQNHIINPKPNKKDTILE